MKLRRPILFIAYMAFLGTMSFYLLGLGDGIVGYTKKTTDFGCGCHLPSFLPSPFVHVEIIGPSQVNAGDTVEYQLLLTSDSAFLAGGTDIAAYYGELYPSPSDSTLKRDSSFKSGGDFELTHMFPRVTSNDTVIWTFTYIAPDTGDVYDTIYANGNAVDLSGSSFDDYWNYADNKVVHVITTSIGNNNGIANDFRLEQNYPNPFNPVTNIKFSLLKASDITLSVYDLNGREVAKLITGQYYTTGEYSVSFEASKYRLSSGVYFYKLSAGSNSEVKKMLLVK